MQYLNRLSVALLLLVVHAVSASEHPIFTVSESNRDAFEQQRKKVLDLITDWRTKVLEDERVQFSSSLHVRFAGESFLEIVDMGPVAIPHLLRELHESEYADYFIDHTLMCIMRAYWSRIAGVEERMRPGRRWPEEERGTLIDWWAEAGMHCHQHFTKLRSAFDARLASGHPASEDLWDPRREGAWQALRQMGLYGVPSVIKRIQDGVSDDYDLLLLEDWHSPPIRVEYHLSSGAADDSKLFGLKYSRSPVHIEKTAADWLVWWESNKEHYWWLHETGGSLVDDD